MILPMKYLEQSYIRQLGTSLEKFAEKKNGELFCFRCPICGDSEKSTTKKRGYLFFYKGTFVFKCFNCGNSLYFQQFLKHISPHLYEQFRLERYREEHPKKEELPQYIFEKPTFGRHFNHHLNSIFHLPDLAADHPAVTYLKQRRMPSERLPLFWWTDNYYLWINSILPEEFKDSDKSDGADSRIVIPFFNRKGELFAVQGRTIVNAIPRYFTKKFTDEPKIYGAERCDFTRKHYVLEGPLNSLFLKNAVAMAGSDTDMSLFDKSLAIVVLDNERRSKEIVKKYASLVAQGWTVCLWPPTILENDINDMILSGKTAEEIQKIIDDNSFSGMEAQLKFANWKRI